MSQPAPTTIDFRQILPALKKHRLLWLAPTIFCTVLATGYAIVKPKAWRATQALLVRDEAAGGFNPQGRFETSDEMKTAQETILQVARNRTVLAAALSQAGPPDEAGFSGEWPRKSDVGRLRSSISVEAPNGAEFGRTEVIHLSVAAPTRERAAALTAAVCDQLEARLQQLRGVKAESVIAELTRAETLAQQELQAATRQLQALETEVGSDLGELRALNDSATGEGNLRTALNQIKNELRQARAGHEANLKQQALIADAQDDPRRLIATPNRLLESQPALRRLKEGLVDAQLRKSQLSGGFSANHPKVQAAAAAEKEVAGQLRRELVVAAEGIAADLEISSDQIQSLQSQLGDVTARLSRLAEIRADYSNLVDEVRQLNDIVENAHRELTDARASQQSAQAASLLTRLEGPQTGDAPLGPRRSMIVLSGLAGGLVTGLGLVFLATPGVQARRRRWSDYLRGGRRADDAADSSRPSEVKGGRRAGDAPASPETSNQAPQRRASDQNPAEAGNESPGRRAYDRPAPIPDVAASPAAEAPHAEQT